MRTNKLVKRIAAVIAIVLAITMIVTSFGWVFASDRNTAYAMTEEDGRYSTEQLAFMQKLMDYLQKNYKDKIEIQDLVEGAYTGMFDALEDPYSVFYLDDTARDSFVTSVNGEFGGIGVSLEMTGGKPVVVAPMAGFPAEAAGVLSGDVILKIDGTNLSGKTLNQIASMLRGEAGTQVTMTVQRNGQTLTFRMTREVIQVASVHYKMLESSIGYIQLTQFDEDSNEEFHAAVAALQANGAKSYIVDIRNNSGGYVNVAAQIAEQFMPAGPIVHFIRQGETLDTLYASGTNRIQAPVVLLVNGGSASAAEILAGAWQDSKTATVVGTATYGKGVAQQVLNLKNGYSMKLSMYYFVTPNRHTIDKIGIQPDVVIANPIGGNAELQEKYSSFVPMKETTKPKLGDTGLNVYGAQQRLAMLGYPVTVTGTVDEATKTAIVQFQAASGLYPYGTLDYTTRDALEQATAAYVNDSGELEDLQLAKAVSLLKK